MKHAVLIPYYGGRDADHSACVDVLKQQGTDILTSDGCPYIDMARGLLAAEGQAKTDADVFVWIDHDIIFQAHEVRMLAEHLWESDYGMLGALYSCRKPAQGMIGRFTPGLPGVTFYQPGLYDAQFLGMGFTAVKRSTFEALNSTCPRAYCPTVRSYIRPYFMHCLDDDHFVNAEHDLMYHGEDISFCRRVHKAGIKIGIDTQPRLLHRGKKDYALEDAAYDAAPWADALVVTFDNSKQPL